MAATPAAPTTAATAAAPAPATAAAAARPGPPSMALSTPARLAGATPPSADREDASALSAAVAAFRGLGVRSSLAPGGGGGALSIDIPRVTPGSAPPSVYLGRPGGPTGAALLLEAPPTSAAAATAVRHLRDVLRGMQDRTHTRDDARLASLGALGLLEVAVAAVHVTAQLPAARDDQCASLALQVVGNLAMVDPNRRRLAAVGVIEGIVACMGTFTAAARVQVRGGRC